MQRGPWQPKPGDRVVRHPREEQMSPVRLTISTPRARSPALATPLVLLYAFAGLVVVGTILLLPPYTHVGGGMTPFVDALFTATSAITVTGLVTHDTATYWTPIGQALILVLVFFGGLSFMTIATFLLIIMGQRLSLAQRLLARDSYQITQLGGLPRFTVYIVVVAAAIQLAGFVALTVRLSFVSDSLAEAAWQGLFQSVSAFNSSGFVNLSESDSLSMFIADPIVLGIMGSLIFLGTISYLATADVIRLIRVRGRGVMTFLHLRRRVVEDEGPRQRTLSLNTKLVLILTAVLTLAGATMFFSSEHDNPKTMGALDLSDKIVVSLFESTSGRTAGFSTVDYSETAQHTNFFFTSLMFIGGASASVAGGIKINTLAVVLVAVISTLGGRSHARAFHREIPHSQVQRATSIVGVALLCVFAVVLALTFTERGSGLAFIDLLFESVSAFGTVGLSTGLTADLSRWGHVILIIAMFVGRVGTLTLGLMMIQRGESDLYRYAQERITIG